MYTCHNRMWTPCDTLPKKFQYDPYKVLHDLSAYYGLQSSGLTRDTHKPELAYEVLLTLYGFTTKLEREQAIYGIKNIHLFFVTKVHCNRAILEKWYGQFVAPNQMQTAAE